MGVDGVSIFMQRKKAIFFLKKKQHGISFLAQTQKSGLSSNTPSYRLSFPRNARGFPIIMCGHLDTAFPILLAYGLEVCSEMTS